MNSIVAPSILLAVAFALPVHAQDADPGSGVALAAREVLVRFDPQVRPAVRGAIAARARGEIVKSSPTLGYHKLRVPEGESLDAALARLRREPGVLWAEPNAIFTAGACTDCPQDPYLQPAEDRVMPMGQNQWGVFTSGLPWLWRQGGGGSASVVVAIVDTGIDDFHAPHADLAPNLHPTGHDYVDDDANPTDAGASDQYGHGTHVAGIVAAAADGAGIAGVAYESKLMIVRVLDCTAGAGCPGTAEDIADGIVFAVDNGARVINLSIQGDLPSNAVREAIHHAIGEGAIVVACSGNQGDTSLRYPAGFDEVIAVGASDSLDNVAGFSNSGAELDVVAPGAGIWSTVPGGTYARWSGTSQATPFVAGVAALIAAKQPNIKQKEMEDYLRSHTEPLADAARDGFGRVGWTPLEDWSDSPPPYSAVRHKNFLWEWLGFDGSAERSISDPMDTDFRPNIGGPGHRDGHDDGTFPSSFPSVPFLPPHLGPTAPLSIAMGVSNFAGPRYGAAPANQLHLDVWFDWNSDGAFGAGERAIADHTENPATWGANGTFASLPVTPVDTHILGNPLVVRTRLAYGASAGSPDIEAKHGEVEDHDLVNFVEEFDSGPPYMLSSSWDFVPDPAPPCMHRGMGGLGVSIHPAVGAPCNGFIESINVMGTPIMNWKEYTTASLSFWYCHAVNGCPPGAAGEFCRVRIDTSGVKHTLTAIPTGTGTMTLDLSAYCGAEAVIVEFVEETDLQGRLAIDDVVITAFDPEPSPAVTDLALVRSSNGKTLSLTWTAQAENTTAPSPPTEAEAAVYDVRHARTPILTPADWEAAERFEPREVTAGGPPVPGTPGTGEAHGFHVPSAFEPYFVALRVGDEVVNLSGLSNSPGDAGAGATLGVDVLALADTIGAPGDTVRLLFRVSNTGTADDSYALSGGDTGAWTLFGLPSAVAVGAGGSVVFAVDARIPLSASGGDRDTVTLVATSLADGSTQDLDAGEIAVSGSVGVPVAGSPAAAPGLHDVGPLPFRERLGFALRLTAGERATVRVYDLGGRLVKDFDLGELSAGEHRLAWDGRDQSGRPVSPGFYFLRARTPSFEQARRLLRLE